MKKRTVIIDNYDSFTYILKQYFGELGGNPVVFKNDEITVAQLKKLKPTHLVISPGPGTVMHKKDVGITFEALKAFTGKIPVLGVCLGHQALGHFFGGKIVKAPQVMHGKRSFIYHTEEGLFRGLKNPFEAMRYHSLAVEDRPLKKLYVTARTEDGVIMGLQHEKYPVFGVQFHPESLGTRDGKKIIQNFLKYE
jgi:anthranilate synthase/aminodeoxychorismate synthase-like glutamine amidotransferase